MIRENDPSEPPEKNELVFAIHLAHGASIAQAATEIGVALATGYRWAKKPEVRANVEQIRAEVLQSAASKIFGIAGKAVATLDRLLDSQAEQICLSAARTILDGSCKLRQLGILRRSWPKSTRLWLH